MPTTVEEEYLCFRKPLFPELKTAKEKSGETGSKLKRLLGSSVEMTEEFMIRQQQRINATQIAMVKKRLALGLSNLL